MTPARHLIVLVLALLAWAGGGCVASAQITDEMRSHYEQWQKTAARADDVMKTNRASDAAMENLRQEIAGYREQFQIIRDANASRIRTLESQLSALGPRPEAGEVEPDDLAQLRQRLNDQLDNVRVPRIVAEEAHTRADGLIREIDRIIRERTTDRLLSRGPSPLNPEPWPQALREVQQGLRDLYRETEALVTSKTIRQQFKRSLLPVVVLTLLGLLLLLRARYWAGRFGSYLHGFGGRGSGVWSFVVSLTKIFLPLIGVVLLVTAVTLTGMLGVRMSQLAEAIPRWAAVVLFYFWMADQLVARAPGDEIVAISPENKRRALVFIRLIGTMLVLHDVVDLFGRVTDIDPSSRAVLAFPVIALTAVLLWQFQRMRLRNRDVAETDAAAPGGKSALGAPIRAVRRGALFLAVAAPVLAAIGYGFAAEAIIYPVVLSLTIISCGVVLQRFLTDAYTLVTGDPAQARDSLFAVLAGFLLALLAVPVLILVWGGRVADLTELWTRFLNGFDIGDTHISPGGFLVFALVFAAGYTATRLIQSGLRNALLPKTRIDPGGQNAIVSGTGYLGIFLASLIAVASAGLDLSSVAIVAGALSVGIGFGLQTIVSNFVSGIILLIERPISKGDWVEVGGIQGYVRDISVRSTRIETFDRSDVIVPNANLISGTVTNYTRGKTIGRVIVPVGVSYGTDPRQVERVLLGIANAHPMVLANPAPWIVFQGFGADSLNFEIRAILRDVNWALSVRSEMNHEIARRFAEEGIEIPFAQRDIWLRNPEALAAALHPRPEPRDAPDGARGRGVADDA